MSAPWNDHSRMQEGEPGAQSDLAHQLRVRLEQQAALASLGRQALVGMGMQELLDEAIRCAAETLDLPFGKILELTGEDLVYRAGVGWGEIEAGRRITPASGDFQAGHTALTGEPVIVEDFAAEERFVPAKLLSDHGVKSSLCVPIQRRGAIWGVFALHSDSPRRFSGHDLNFAQAMANIVGDAVERNANEELQAQLAAIVETSTDAIFRKDLDGTITSWNAAAAAMYGYGPQEVIGRRVDEVLFPAELLHTFEEIMATVRAGGSVRGMETERIRKDGSRIPISLSVSPIRDQEGRVIAASTVARDISEQKRAQEELKRAHGELERRVADRTRELRDSISELESFSYAVSHDLRAPLRSIDGFARALLEDYGDELEDLAHNYLERIIRASHRMSRLIDDLLGLARLTRAPLHVEPVNLAELGRQTLAELHEQDPDRRVRFEAPPALSAPADRHLLRIALHNLLDNALKFTRTRAEAVIRLGSLTQEGEIVYFVEDNGIGFDMRYATRLFVPFQRLHTNEIEGTGIGLATVQRIINRHGGRLWATSEVDGGTTFFFTLPAQPGDSRSGRSPQVREEEAREDAPAAEAAGAEGASGGEASGAP